MKLTKVAAVVAGSVAALGASAPAFAAEASPAALPPMSLTSGFDQTLNALVPVTDNLPQTVGAGLAEQGESINKTVGVVQRVNNFRNNLPGEVLHVANGLTQTSPMLGGVKLNGGAGA